MFRNNEFPKTKTSVNCLITDFGIGDLLCSLMAVNYILTKAPWINLLIWVPNYLKDFTKNVLPKHAIVRDFTEAQKKYNENLPCVTTKKIGQHTPMRVNPVKYGFHVLCDYSPTLEEMSFLKANTEAVDLSKYNLPDKFVAIQGAYVEKVKTMPIETFNNIVDYVINKGYIPVFIGKTENKMGVGNFGVKAFVQDGYNLDRGINLIDKTDLLESTAIIAKAKALVCMDGGLMHLAAFTPTKIIAGCTFINPLQIMPVRDNILGKDFYYVEPDVELECRGCQSNWTLLYGHDYRECWYGPNDYSCVSQITSEKFIKHLENIV